MSRNIVVCFALVFTVACAQPKSDPSSTAKLDLSSPEKTIGVFYQGWKEKRLDLIEAASSESEEDKEYYKKYGRHIYYSPDLKEMSYKIISKRLITEDDVQKYLETGREFHKTEIELPDWYAANDVVIITEASCPNAPAMKVEHNLRLIGKEWKIVAYSYWVKPNNAYVQSKLDLSSPEKTVGVFYQGWQEHRPELIEAASWKPEKQKEVSRKHGSGYHFSSEGRKIGDKIISKKLITEDDVKGFLEREGELPYWYAANDVEITIEVSYQNAPPMKVSLGLRLIEKEWKIVGSSHVPDENYPDIEPPPDL
jgi:hypothetical protein